MMAYFPTGAPDFQWTISENAADVEAFILIHLRQGRNIVRLSTFMKRRLFKAESGWRNG